MGASFHSWNKVMPKIITVLIYKNIIYAEGTNIILGRSITIERGDNAHVIPWMRDLKGNELPDGKYDIRHEDDYMRLGVMTTVIQ